MATQVLTDKDFLQSDPALTDADFQSNSPQSPPAQPTSASQPEYHLPPDVLTPTPVGKILDDEAQRRRFDEDSGQQFFEPRTPSKWDNPLPQIPQMEAPEGSSELYKDRVAVHNKLADVINGVATPDNIALMMGTAGVSAAAPTLGKAAPVIQKLMKWGFSLAGANNVVQDIRTLKDAPDGPAKAKAITGIIANGALTAGLILSKEGGDTNAKQETTTQQKADAAKPADSGSPAGENVQTTPEESRPGSSGQPGSGGDDVQKAALVPGIKVGEGVTPGKAGDTHADIVARAGKADDADIVVAAGDDSNHVFQTPDGKTLNREEAGKYADENGLRPDKYAGKPLQSQHLNEQPKAGDLNDEEKTQKENEEKGNEKDVAGEAPGSGKSMGPGAAAAGEIPEAKKVSIANAEVDKARASRGDLPLMTPARKAMGVTWDEAMQKVEKDPERGGYLVDAVRKGNIKAVDATDEAVMGHELIRVRNERDVEAERASDPDASEEDRVASNAKAQLLESRVNEVEQAMHDVGTTSARALQWRQSVLRDDYTQAAIERKLRTAKGGQALTPEEISKAKNQATEIKQLEDKAEGVRQTKVKKDADQAADEAVKGLKQETKKTGKKKGTPTPEIQQKNLTQRMKDAAKEGATPQDSTSLINQLALSFVRSGVTEREPLIDAVHGVLKNVFPDIQREQTRDAISGYGDFKPLDKEAAKVTLRGLKGEMQQIGKIDDMQKGQAPKKTGMERRSPTDQERALQKKVNDLKKKGGFQVTDPATQLRTALDAVKTRLKNQIKDFALRMETGEKPPKKGGVPYDQEAEKLQALRDRIRQTLTDIEGKPEMTDEQRVKIAQSALEKQIADYNRRIKEKDFTGMDRTSKTPPNQLLDTLRARRDAIKEEYSQLRNADESVQAEKAAKDNATALKRTQDQIAELDRRLQEGDLAPKERTGKEVSQKVEDARLLRDSLSRQLKDMQDAMKPKKSPDEIALQAYKSRTANRIVDLQERLSKGDVAAHPRKMLTLDPEAQKLQAKANALKDQVNMERIRQQQAGRTKFEKYQDTFVKWRRAFILSHPGIVAKLGSAAALRMISMPTEDIVGSGLSMIPGIRDISAKAPIEGGGFKPTAYAQSIASAFTKGMADAWSDLKTGKSDLDRLYGQKEAMPREAIEFFGSVHAALKAPVKRTAFEYAFAKHIDWAARNGLDVTDPMTQTQVAMKSYEWANRQIFMQSNMVTRAFNAGMRSLEQPEKGSTHPSFGKKVLASAARVALPIRGVPTNIAGEVFEYTLGSITGSAKAASALRGGVENLKPEEADTIMRLLKKGSVGGAMLALGWYGYKDVAGYYQPRDKPKPGDLKPGEVKVDGYTIPKTLFHGAIQGPLMIGATARRVAEKTVHGQEQGAFEGALAGAYGPLKETPFFYTGEEVGRLTSPPYAVNLGNEVADIAVPGIVSDVATAMDQQNGETVKRTPRSFGEALKLQIPGLRKDVSESNNSRSTSKSMSFPKLRFEK